MATKEIHFKMPSLIKRIGESVGFYEIEPSDITIGREDLNNLYNNRPDLFGDQTAIGPGDDGNCQSWRGDRGWWKKLVKPRKI